jgi:hypothetical protein
MEIILSERKESEDLALQEIKMNFKKLNDYELVLLTELIIVSDTLRAAMDEITIKEEFYLRFPNINLKSYEKVIKYRKVDLYNFIIISQAIIETEREK